MSLNHIDEFQKEQKKIFFFEKKKQKLLRMGHVASGPIATLTTRAPGGSAHKNKGCWLNPGTLPLDLTNSCKSGAFSVC
jgi:hypothetical protein